MPVLLLPTPPPLADKTTSLSDNKSASGEPSPFAASVNADSQMEVRGAEVNLKSKS